MITTKNGKAPLILDVECYRDYFLVKFRNAITGQMVSFPFHEGQPFDAQTVKSLMLRRTTISFNGNGYDIVMIFLAIEGFTNASLKAASDRIIQQKLKPWHIEREYGIRIPKIDHVDIMEVAPGQIGLKLYGARLGCPKLQDLPIEPDASIAPEQRDTLDLYCGNDLLVTGDLANYLKSQLQLREAMSAEYGVDLRSKSDAQIAEAVIVSELTKIMGVKPERLSVSVGTAYKYKAPDWISFRSPRLREIFEIVKRADFVVGDSGHVNMPPELNELDIWIGAGRYRMGIGGLHSSECRVAHHASEKVSIIDRDVASYYPNIILNNNFTPAHMGEVFLHVYRNMVKRRLEAKKKGEKTVDKSLKVCINGSFGKFGSKWSTLYSPDLMIQVTITGQLALLMMIEGIEAAGIRVISANTDGIVIKCPKAREPELNQIIATWEKRTNFVTEETRYKAIYSRDVNSYIAVKEKGGVKQKGAYSFTGSSGMEIEVNPSNYVCIDAVIAHLTDGTPIEDTIYSCADIRRFLSVRSVTGGAIYGREGAALSEGTYLGKVVRWYYAEGVESYCIRYRKNGNTVPLSQGCRPMMDLVDEWPDDIDYPRYVAIAKQMLIDIGHTWAPADMLKRDRKAIEALI